MLLSSFFFILLPSAIRHLALYSKPQNIAVWEFTLLLLYFSKFILWLKILVTVKNCMFKKKNEPTSTAMEKKREKLLGAVNFKNCMLPLQGRKK